MLTVPIACHCVCERKKGSTSTFLQGTLLSVDRLTISHEKWLATRSVSKEKVVTSRRVSTTRKFSNLKVGFFADGGSV